jgi:hypothetical protein
MKIKYIKKDRPHNIEAKAIRETPHGYLVHVEGNSFYLKDIEAIEL